MLFEWDTVGYWRFSSLGCAGSYGIIGGGEAVGNIGGGGAVGTGTLGGRSGIPDQRVIGGMVGVTGLGTGRDNCMIFDNFISACVCSLQNFAVGETGYGYWRAAMSSWMESVMFSCGERPGNSCSWGKKRTVLPWQTQRVSGHQMSKQQ